MGGQLVNIKDFCKGQICETCTKNLPQEKRGQDKELKSNSANVSIKKKSSRNNKQPKVKHIRLSAYNRVMATIRHPKYLKEYAEYIRLLNSDDKKAESFGKKIAKKWNQYSTPDREFLLPIRPVPYHTIRKSSFNHIINNPVEVIDINKPNTISKKYPQIELKDTTAKTHAELVIEVHKGLFNDKKRTKKEATFSKDDIANYIKSFTPQYSYKKGRFLYLMIDLDENETTITKELKSIIKQYRKYMTQNEGRKGETTVDPWLVYDKYRTYNYQKNKEMKYTDIARELSGLKGNASPGCNRELNLWFKQVQTAYKKACDMIEQVGKEVKTT